MQQLFSICKSMNIYFENKNLLKSQKKGEW
jgi:hypothetical protein